MFQRLIERLRFWWQAREQERRGKNPLTYIAVIALFLIGFDIYKVVVGQHVAWTAILSDALLVAFLVLYTRHSPVAWLVLPTFGALGLLESPLLFFSSSPHYSPRIRLFTFAFGALFSLAVIGYGFLVRHRYEIYLHDRSETAQNT